MARLYCGRRCFGGAILHSLDAAHGVPIYYIHNNGRGGLPKMAKRTDTKIIVTTGAESTGKTDLCQHLATVFGAPWVPELARGYVEQLGRPYSYDDVIAIARLQLAEFEKTANAGHPLVFFDTDLIITKVWLDVVYGRCPAWIPEAIRSHPTTLHLLCLPDIPWIPDPVRENGGLMREKLSEIYRNELETFGLPYAEIGGDGDIRRERGVEAVRRVIG